MLTSKQHISNRKAFIIQSGRTQKEVYEKIGVSRIGFYKAIYCITKNPKMHELICNALSVSKEEFWPEFYGKK